MAGPAMSELTVTGSTFEARVLAARLGADGILTQLRGANDGPCPLPGAVVVLVETDQLHEARGLLYTDQVEACFPDDAWAADPAADGAVSEGSG